MRAWMRKTITSSAVLIVAATIAIVLFTKTDTYAQFLESYNALSKAEQHWVLRHPIAAFRTHKLAEKAQAAAQEIKSDPDMDNDLNGGMADAFKHTLWMALTAQKIGHDKAVSLGIAHEEGNRMEFENNPNRDNGLIQDKIMSEMDLFNNEIGATLGAENSKVSFDVLEFLVKDAVIKGRCRKIKKKDNSQYLDIEGNVIDINKYKGVWEIPKVLIPSNKPQNNDNK